MSPLKVAIESDSDLSRYGIAASSKGREDLNFPLTLEAEERLNILDRQSLAVIALVSATDGKFGGYVNGLLLRVGRRAQVNGLDIEGISSQ